MFDVISRVFGFIVKNALFLRRTFVFRRDGKPVCRLLRDASNGLRLLFLSEPLSTALISFNRAIFAATTKPILCKLDFRNSPN